MGVSIKVEAVELEAALKRAETACRNFSSAGRQIGELMVRSAVRNFEAGGRPDKWMPVSGSTMVGYAGGIKKSFTKKGFFRASFKKIEAGHKTLILSGRLRNSIGYKVYADAVEIGTNLIYAAAHQFGRDDKKRGSPLPARPFLVVQDEDERAIAAIIEQHVAGPLK